MTPLLVGILTLGLSVPQGNVDAEYLRQFDKLTAKSASEAGVKTARGPAEKGLPLASLRTLFLVWGDVTGARLMTNAPSAQKTDPKAYADLFSRMESELTVRQKDLRKQSLEKPLAVRGLQEIALGQTGPLLRSGKLYGEQTTFENGLYYVGNALGELEFAEFAKDVRLASSGEPLKLRKLSGEIQVLDDQITRAYDQSSRDDLRRFAFSNMMLKQATELNEKGWLAGATIAYLESLASFRLVGIKPLPREEIETKLGDLESRLPAGQDHSIGRMFAEVARLRLGEGDAGLNSATVMVRDVLPAYFELLGPAKPAPAGTEKPLVTVRLVRWPYT